MAIESGIRDNRTRGKLGDFLSQSIRPDSKLSFVSAYFTIYAYHKLKDKLDSIDSLRFLFGEPTFLKQIDPQRMQSRNYQIQDNALVVPLENRLEQSKYARECSQWIKDKVEIKSMVKPNFLHGKLYHIEQANETENAIMGSSNFTVGGLGMSKNCNMELNLIVSDNRDVKDLKGWFNELWNADKETVRDVKEEVLKYLDQLYANNAPELVYYKTLYHLFEKYLLDQTEIDLSNQKVGFYDSEIWNKLYNFQKDGVKGAINKLEKHGGCIIADSVGLGKTYEALAIIRYYEALNYRVLVLCPKKLGKNWTLYQTVHGNIYNPFQRDRFSYTVLYHTDLGRTSGESRAGGTDLSAFNWGAYDLIVIDESHNLRGNPKERRREDKTVINRTKFLLENVIKAGKRSKVLMLSATPVNTTLKDLRNQIHYITEGRDDALLESTGIGNISDILRTTQRQFVNWVEHSKGMRDKNDLYRKLDSGFFKLLDELTIARSRKHILKFYKEDGLQNFPTRLKPIPIYPEIDSQGRFNSYDKVVEEIEKYNLYLYSPSNYVLDEYKELYREKDPAYQIKFAQKYREKFLIGMMKMNFLKRLESSIHAFRLTLGRTAEKISSLMEKIAAFEAGKDDQDTEIDVDQQVNGIDIEEEDDYDTDMYVGEKLKYKLKHLDLDKWKQDLEKDKEQIETMLQTANKVKPEDDAKLAKLKEVISHKLKNPINPGNRKILVFTAFADTANYLYQQLSGWIKQEHGIDTALVTGSETSKYTLSVKHGDPVDFEAMLTYFAPIAKGRDLNPNMPKHDIDLLIGTDCISEGQNLQDCDYVINYDIHWNPVRIIQRYGRIDRLNSPNEQIQLVNFWPIQDLDKYINLKHRVEARMMIVDITATGDDDVISEEQFLRLETDEMRFRVQQLKRLKDEVLDLEDLDENINLTDFNLDDFRIDLINYLKENQVKLEQTPLGIYAVTASPQHDLWEDNQLFNLSEPQKMIMRPGVIFCLRYLHQDEGMEKLSPLHPYFLVYLHESGEVRFRNSNAKQILELFRILCLDKKAANEALYDIFEEKTNQGQDMRLYNRLLANALEDIRETIDSKAKQDIQTKRDAVIPIKVDGSENKFELITWLVIL